MSLRIRLNAIGVGEIENAPRYALQRVRIGVKIAVEGCAPHAEGGSLSLAGIYMTPIPEIDYDKCLYRGCNLRSVTANTRKVGRELLRLSAEVHLHAHRQELPLAHANEALQALKQDRINGAAILRVSGE